MVRHVLPVVVVLALAAGCGGKRDEAAGKAEPAPTGPVAAAAPSPTAVPSPTANKKDAAPVAAAPALVPQPEAPELPAVVDLATTPEMLSAHALIVAREQVQAGLSGQVVDVTQRHAFILASWQAPYQQRLATLIAVREKREARARRELATAKRMAEHEQRVDAVDAEYAPIIRAEQAKMAPILER